MKIITPENIPIETNTLHDEAHYGVLDFSDRTDVDFRFEPIDLLDLFGAYRVELIIDEKHSLSVPFNWSILCSDTENLVSIPIYTFRGRSFEVLVFNPITGSMLSFADCRVGNTYPDTSWSSPQIFQKKYIASPIINEENPPCVYINMATKEDVVSIGDLF